jgi:hypothetical protein
MLVVSLLLGLALWGVAAAVGASTPLAVAIGAVAAAGVFIAIAAA